MLGICKFDVFVVSLTSIKSLVCPHAILHFLFVCLAFKSMFFSRVILGTFQRFQFLCCWRLLQVSEARISMSKKPLLTEVAVEDGQSPWDLSVGKPHNSKGLSEQE